jgi:hypothetical protein
MKLPGQCVLVRAALLAVSAAGSAACLSAQVPAPVAAAAVDTAVPIIIKTLKPHKDTHPRFEGTVVNATIAQITVRAKGNDMAIETFPLSEDASTKMLAVIDKGGYQYGDKVTVFYDPDTKKALRVKGKPSKAS